MPDRAIHVPTGLTTEGLLGRRYMAWFIDSIIVFPTILAALALGLAGEPMARIMDVSTDIALMVCPLQAAARNLPKEGPFIALAFLPGGNVLPAIWLGAQLVVMHRSPAYQAIHDRFARTWVAAPEETTRLHLA